MPVVVEIVAGISIKYFIISILVKCYKGFFDDDNDILSIWKWNELPSSPSSSSSSSFDNVATFELNLRGGPPSQMSLKAFHGVIIGHTNDHGLNWCDFTIMHPSHSLTARIHIEFMLQFVFGDDDGDGDCNGVNGQSQSFIQYLLTLIAIFKILIN